jgi:hypothetical protein
LNRQAPKHAEPASGVHGSRGSGNGRTAEAQERRDRTLSASLCVVRIVGTAASGAHCPGAHLRERPKRPRRQSGPRSSPERPQPCRRGLAWGVSTLGPGIPTSGQDDPPDAGLQDRDVEVQQQTQRLIRGFEVGDHLGDVDGKDLRDCFELHPELAVNHQVQLRLADGTGVVADGGSAAAGRRRCAAGSVPGQRASSWMDSRKPGPGRDDPLSQRPSSRRRRCPTRAWFLDDAHPKSSSDAER